LTRNKEGLSLRLALAAVTRRKRNKRFFINSKSSLINILGMTIYKAERVAKWQRKTASGNGTIQFLGAVWFT